MRAYDDIKHMLCDEIKKISRQEELTSSTLDTLDKLTHSLKSITTIMAMEDEGYSKTGRYRSSRYADGGRSMRGRGRGYSYGDAKDDMIEQLEDMLEMAESKAERSAIERCIRQLESDEE